MKTRIGVGRVSIMRRDIMEFAPEGACIGDSVRVDLGHVCDQITLPIFRLDR